MEQVDRKGIPAQIVRERQAQPAVDGQRRTRGDEKDARRRIERCGDVRREPKRHERRRTPENERRGAGQPRPQPRAAVAGDGSQQEKAGIPQYVGQHQQLAARRGDQPVGGDARPRNRGERSRPAADDPVDGISRKTHLEQHFQKPEGTDRIVGRIEKGVQIG